MTYTAGSDDTHNTMTIGNDELWYILEGNLCKYIIRTYISTMGFGTNMRIEIKDLKI